MRMILIFALFSIVTFQLHSQTIEGKVIDSSKNEPLKFVSIGIVNSPTGTITDEYGYFKIDATGQPANAIIRFSMISYKPQEFTIEELSTKENTIRLVNSPTQLNEVVIRPHHNKTKNLGAASHSVFGYCGWGETQFGNGNEVGTKIQLGTSPVQILKMHLRLHSHSFDSTLFRLHIRDIINNMPANELLSDNILITITKKKGWVDIDLRKYNLYYSGDIALTIEWLKVIGRNPERHITYKGKNILGIGFNVKQGKNYTFYSKLGAENKWRIFNNSTPSFYLTVKE